MPVSLYIISGILLFAVFILFLVVSKTMNGILNLLFKIEYLVTREHEYFQEGLEIRKIMLDKITLSRRPS